MRIQDVRIPAAETERQKTAGYIDGQGGSQCDIEKRLEASSLAEEDAHTTDGDHNRAYAGRDGMRIAVRQIP